MLAMDSIFLYQKGETVYKVGHPVLSGHSDHPALNSPLSLRASHAADQVTLACCVLSLATGHLALPE
jgi:hypothetical protein